MSTEKICRKIFRCQIKKVETVWSDSYPPDHLSLDFQAAGEPTAPMQESGQAKAASQDKPEDRVPQTAELLTQLAGIKGSTPNIISGDRNLIAESLT